MAVMDIYTLAVKLDFAPYLDRLLDRLAPFIPPVALYEQRIFEVIGRVYDKGGADKRFRDQFVCHAKLAFMSDAVEPTTQVEALLNKGRPMAADLFRSLALVKASANLGKLLYRQC